MHENMSDFKEAQARSRARLNELLLAIPKDIDARDDVIAEKLCRENSSAKSKLAKIYSLMKDVSQEVAPYVACNKGCSDCCKMNVSISLIEAERLAEVSKKTLVVVKTPIYHAEEKFTGVPCPFLMNNVCSVYETRPFACRAHYSFDTSAYWCHPERAYEGEMSLLRMGGAQRAYEEIVASSSMRGFADIRDFFPT